MKVLIYTLSDPFTKEIRYIGKTNQMLLKRLNGHIQDAKIRKSKTHNSNWIYSLILKNQKPIIELLDEVNENTAWQLIEQYWISQFKCWGFNLLNTTIGGDGFQGSKRTKEACIKTSISLKKSYKEGRRIITEELKEANRIRMTGRIVSEETKDKIRKANLGKTYSYESRSKKFKKVYQFDLNNNFIREWDSLTEASIYIKGTKGNISNAIYGRNNKKSYKGFIWKYNL